MDSHRFPRAARVRARSDFDRTLKHGRRAALPVLAVHGHAGAQPARLGLAVSRKVDPRAVGRNRIKRALRDGFRRHRAQLAGGDYVLVARRDARECDGATLQAALLSLLRRVGALPPPAVAGTMPAASSSPVPPPAPRAG